MPNILIIEDDLSISTVCGRRLNRIPAIPDTFRRFGVLDTVSKACNFWNRMK